MPADDQDLQLKIDGAPVRQLGGAPAEVLAEALRAIQRLALLIGMKREGQRFGHKARPSAKVRRTYSVICHPPVSGSYLQPVSVTSMSGQSTAAAAFARGELLRSLSAFNSGEDAEVEKAIPDPRQRWFMADAAHGLLPLKGSEIEISIRSGKGRYSFVSSRARPLLERIKASTPPQPETEELVGKVKAIDFATTALTVKPSTGRRVKTHYPLKLEPLLQRNVRRRLRLVGRPDINSSGDLIGFTALDRVVEVEPSARKIESFQVGDTTVRAVRPYGYLQGYDVETSMFVVQDHIIGLDVFCENPDEVEKEVIIDLEMLWRTYAQVDDDKLTPDAQARKRALRERFKEGG